MDTPAIRNNNPGNIKDPSTGTFKKFSTPQEGYAALLNDLQAKQTGTTTTGLGPSSTLVDFASTYAPASDKNNPGVYTASLANELGVRPDTQLKDLDLKRWAAAVAKNEDRNSVFGSQDTSGFNPNPYSNPTGSSPGAINYSGVDTPEAPKAEKPLSFMPQVGQIGSDLSENITGRLKDFSTAGTTAMQGGSGALLHIGSGLLQGAGAIAGGIGDVANAGLQFIPGVQAAEKIIGKGFESLAKTDTGNSLLKPFKDFAVSNPEIAKDIEAGINVLAAIPILRGLSALKLSATNAGVTAFKGKVEKEAGEEIRKELLSKPSQSLSRAESRGLNPIGTLVKNPNYLPEVLPTESGGFAYSVERATKSLDESLNADEDALQSLLETAVKKNVLVSVEKAQQGVLSDIRREYVGSGNFTPAVNAVNDYFDSVKASLGGRTLIDLRELNGIKRDVRGAVNFDNLGGKSSAIKYQIGQSLMKQVEDIASKSGAKGVHALNRTMAEKIEALRVLDAIDGRKLKVSTGTAKELAIDAAGIAGEKTGSAFGLPFAGTLASRGITKTLLRGAAKPKSALLKLNNHRPSGGTLRQGIKRLAGGLSLQGLVRPPEEREK